jgi:ribosome-binding factor A
VSQKITYYTILGDSDNQPRGLVRRIETENGFTDEALRENLNWTFTPVLVEWERGDFADELIEVSHEQASKILAYFRAKWAGDPQHGD